MLQYSRFENATTVHVNKYDSLYLVLSGLVPNVVWRDVPCPQDIVNLKIQTNNRVYKGLTLEAQVATLLTL